MPFHPLDFAHEAPWMYLRHGTDNTDWDCVFTVLLLEDKGFLLAITSVWGLSHFYGIELNVVCVLKEIALSRCS